MKKIIAVALLSLSCACLSIEAHPHNQKNNSTAPVRVMQVNSVSHKQSVTAVGTIVAPEMANVSSSVDGHVTGILFTNGDQVVKDKPLIKLDDRTEKANLAKATAKAQSSALLYQRDNQLVDKHMISQQELDTAKAQYLQDQADVHSAQAELDKRNIKAPFAGTVGEVKISIGDYIKAGQPLVDMVGDEALRVDYSIPEDLLEEAQLGDHVVLHATINPKEKIKAVLTFISPSINTQTHTIDCQATITSGDISKLRPGMFVDVKQFINAKKTMLMVPEAAVVSYNGQTVVYTVNNGKAKANPVQTGVHRNGLVQITKGLQSGDYIISSGQGQITDGQNVQVLNQKK